MTLKNIVDMMGWSSVEEFLKEIYPKEIQSLDGFKKVFYDLKDMIPKPSVNERKLRICYYEDHDDSFHGVDFIEDGQVYGLDFLDWQEVLAMIIDPDTFNCYSIAEIIVHILWEVTFYGFSFETVSQRGLEILDQYGK